MTSAEWRKLCTKSTLLTSKWTCEIRFRWARTATSITRTTLSTLWRQCPTGSTRTSGARWLTLSTDTLDTNSFAKLHADCRRQVLQRMDNNMKINGKAYTYEIKEIPTIGLVVFMTRKFKKTRDILCTCKDIEDGVEKVNKYEHWQMGK